MPLVRVSPAAIGIGFTRGGLMSYRIVKGPPKNDLFMASFYGKTGNRLRVQFRIENALSALDVACTIMKVEWEDGSGHSWNLGGYAVLPDDACPRPFKAYYRTDSSAGHFNFLG
jgi:hypothetical protein